MSNSKKDICYLNIGNLLLDIESPRLPVDLCTSDQKKTLDYMLKAYFVEELVEAIGENGYFYGEPLVVIKHPNLSEKYIVVEGNRRLSALKILNDQKLTSLKYLQSLVGKAKYKPSEIPCVTFDDRKEVLAYLGIRHISGVRSWGALSKARYIKKLFDSLGDSFSLDEKITGVTRSLGGKSDYVKRNLRTLHIYNIVKSKNFFELNKVDEMTFKFSVFYSVLAKPDIREFIGISNGFEFDFEETINFENLKWIVKIVFEERASGGTILGDYRDLDILALIVSCKDAVEELKKTESIRSALEKNHFI